MAGFTHRGRAVAAAAARETGKTRFWGYCDPTISRGCSLVVYVKLAACTTLVSSGLRTNLMCRE